MDIPTRCFQWASANGHGISAGIDSCPSLELGGGQGSTAGHA